MLTSTRFITSIYLCLLLAWKNNGLLTSSWLAKRVQTNPVVVRRLLALLRDAQLVHSEPGTQGGYRLAKSAEEISLWDIYQAIMQRELYTETNFAEDCPVASQLDQALEPTFLMAEMSMGVTFEQTRLSDMLTRSLPRIEASAA
ncbi:MAG: Rrf2 family transcriptional regulator [Salibacteraceae bacterium]